MSLIFFKTKIYKNYTLEQFIKVYENASYFAYWKKDYSPSEDWLELNTLAKNMLSLSRYYTHTEDLKNKGITIDKFIKEKYWCKFKFDFFLPTESGTFYYILFLGVSFQLSWWGIIPMEEE